MRISAISSNFAPSVHGTPGSAGAASRSQPAKNSQQPSDVLELSDAGRAQAAGIVAELSEEELQVVEELQARDTEVRAHEQAHLAAAGPYARGGPTYTYQRGPDGQRYAIGGEVQIDTSPIAGDPEATIQKARVIQAAARAPAEPSAQDQRVAAAAAKMEVQARQELREQQSAEARGEEPQRENRFGAPRVSLAHAYNKPQPGSLFDAVA